MISFVLETNHYCVFRCVTSDVFISRNFLWVTYVRIICTNRKASKLGATLDVLELTTKPRCSQCNTDGMCCTKVLPPLSPLCCSLLDSAVDLDGDVLLKKTFVSGEEITGFISEVNRRGRDNGREGGDGRDIIQSI